MFQIDEIMNPPPLGEDEMDEGMDQAEGMVNGNENGLDHDDFTKTGDVG